MLMFCANSKSGSHPSDQNDVRNFCSVKTEGKKKIERKNVEKKNGKRKEEKIQKAKKWKKNDVQMKIKKTTKVESFSSSS